MKIRHSTPKGILNFLLTSVWWNGSTHPSACNTKSEHSTKCSYHTVIETEPMRKCRTWLSYECLNIVNTFFFTVLLTLHNAHLISSYPIFLIFFLWIPAECRYVIIQLLKSKQRQLQIKKTDTLIFSFLIQVLCLATLYFF